MNQYILLIYNNAITRPTDEEWGAFFIKAKNSGFFKGGSELGTGSIIGKKPSIEISALIGGYMRFDADNKSVLLKFLSDHPIVLHGGTIELIEMPKS